MADAPSAACLAYYAAPGPLTDLRAHAARVRGLPASLAHLCGVVQGLVVHPFLTSLYGLEPASVRQDDLETRRAAELVERVLALDARPLDEPRPPERRVFGNCRHHAVLLCALLRTRGVPARARCGFANYFEPERGVDHWVCETWDVARSAWRLVDSQLDARQREFLRIPFDPLDVPRDAFLVAGEAWRRCRSGVADPDRFGILDMHGLWFVRGNVVRDVASLAKRELLPWDGWGLAATTRESNAEELALLDRAAALTLDCDARHAELLALQADEPGFCVPPVVRSFNLGGAEVHMAPGVSN